MGTCLLVDSGSHEIIFPTGSKMAPQIHSVYIYEAVSLFVHAFIWDVMPTQFEEILAPFAQLRDCPHTTQEHWGFK
jgi:hypothetical protein